MLMFFFSELKAKTLWKRKISYANALNITKTVSDFLALGNVVSLNGISTEPPQFSFNSLRRSYLVINPHKSYRLLKVTQCFRDGKRISKLHFKWVKSVS